MSSPSSPPTPGWITSRSSPRRPWCSISAASPARSRPTTWSGCSDSELRWAIAPQISESVHFPQPVPFLLLFHDLGDQLDHVRVAVGLDVAGLDRAPVALQRPLLGQLVELRAVDLDQDALVLGEVLGD